MEMRVVCNKMAYSFAFLWLIYQLSFYVCDMCNIFLYFLQNDSLIGNFAKHISHLIFHW